MTNSKKPTPKAEQKKEMQVTRIKYKTEMKSDFMRSYIDGNIGSLITLYGRIGGLLRLVKDDSSLSAMVEDWVTYNEKLAYYQFEESQAQLDQIKMQAVNIDDIEMEVERPKPLTSVWQVNHASYSHLIRLLMTLDKFLFSSETLYFKGKMGDVQINQLNRQVQHVIDSYLERILKATSPGKKRDDEGYKYNNRDLLRHIRDAGYRLEFHTLPKELASIVEEYNQRYSKYKSLVAEREIAAKRKLNEQKKKPKTVETKDTTEASEEPTQAKSKAA